MPAPVPHILARRGVSLVEVLVAAVLLGVGVSGAMAAFATSVRFRASAVLRDVMASAGDARLSWFEARPCSAADTVAVSSPGAVVTERWEVRRAGGMLTLDGVVRTRHAGRELRATIRAERLCECRAW